MRADSAAAVSRQTGGAGRLLLSRGGELALIGVLTFVCSVPLITMAAAGAAAWRALESQHAGAPGLTGTYLRAFVDRLRGSLLPQALWLAVVAVAAVDLWFGASAAPGTPTGIVFCALGGLGLALALIVRPFLVARLAVAGDHDRLRTRLADALAIAGSSPWRTMIVLVLDLMVIISGFAALILLPLALAIVLPIQRGLILGSVGRLPRLAAGADPADG